ncbi:MAG: multidrug DMT transporter permease [Ignavibacteria bacterium]|nr:multidrug DMT transporter permease [Ignavibacteria bacterium]
MTYKDNLKAYIAWSSICIIWGTTYLAIRIGVEDLPPMLFAGMRWLIAGPILLLVLRIKGYAIPKKSDFIPIAIIGLSLLGLGNGFVVFAEQWVPSGLTSLLITTVPFWMVGLEFITPNSDKLNKKIVAGLILGLAGVGLIFWGDLENLFNVSYLLGVIGLMIAVISWSAGSVYSKYKKVSVHPLMSAAFQMTIAGVVLSTFGISLGEISSLHFTKESLIAFSYLIVFGSLIGYASYIYAIAHLPVSLVSTYAYVNPIIALFLGWLILDEKITLTIIIASIIILLGVAVVKKGTMLIRMRATN